MSALPAPGSMAAHDALVLAYVAWHGAEGDFDVAPTTDNAVKADRAWLVVLQHAVNCGCKFVEPSILTWVRQKIASYGRLMGREADALLLVGEPPQ